MYKMLLFTLSFLVISFGWRYVLGQCSADCRTAYYLTDPSNRCNRFRYKDTGTAAFHAWNGINTFNQVNTEKRPANTTGKKIKVYLMVATMKGVAPCLHTCGAAQQPQEVTAGNYTESYNFDTDQRKCTQAGSS